MANLQQLQALSLDELMAELEARQKERDKQPAARNELLREFDDDAIIAEIKSHQKVIYGVDDRVDLFALNDFTILGDADGVVALFPATAVMDNGNGTSNLVVQNFATLFNVCPTEPFSNQPTGPDCSGFLVAPDVIATAAHCVNAGTLANIRFVFGFRMLNAATPPGAISNNEIYSGVAIIGRQHTDNATDWALVRLDRPVANHRILPFRRSGTTPAGQPVHIIGHPCGLPTKYAAGAVVRDSSPAAFFVANLDSYGGNSGSPVFNSTTHEVEGVLVRGERDFVRTAAGCRVSLVCPTTGCRGEECTRTTEFSQLLPVAQGTVTVRRNNTGNGGVFGSNQDWTGGPFFGSRGTFFADLTGDGRADAIAVNDDTVTVRLNTGSNFGPNQDWTGGPFFGSRGTFFARVTGNSAAAIAVNDNGIFVRRSTGSSFMPSEDWTGGPFFGSRGTFFARLTGGHVDAIAVNDNGIFVRRNTGRLTFGPVENWTGGPFFGSRGTFFADLLGRFRDDVIAVNDDTVTARLTTGNGFGPNQDWTGGPFFGIHGIFFAPLHLTPAMDAIAVN
jgi:hypothetical protein